MRNNSIPHRSGGIKALTKKMFNIRTTSRLKENDNIKNERLYKEGNLMHKRKNK